MRGILLAGLAVVGTATAQTGHVVRVTPAGDVVCAVEPVATQPTNLRATPIALEKGAASTLFDLYTLDASGEGMFDLTPATGGGNPGTTLGQRRAALIQYAAQIWSRHLVTGVPVTVSIDFKPLDCDVLGGAYAKSYAYVPQATYWYPIGLAEGLMGGEINAPAPFDYDIVVELNSARGTGACPGTTGFGLSLVRGPVVTGELLPTVLHELAHGLGFGTNTCTNPTGCGVVPSGGYFYGRDIYSYFAYDFIVGKFWKDMTDGERAFSARSTSLVWNGLAVTTEGVPYLQQGVLFERVKMHAPLVYAPGSSVSHFDESASPDLLMEPRATPALFEDLDLTPALLEDEGWSRRKVQRVTVVMHGPGSVVSDASNIGILCPPDCGESYDPGNVTLTASPERYFTHWGGACSGTSGTACTISIGSAPVVVDAFFDPEPPMFKHGFED